MLTPTQAGFDGAKGIRLGVPHMVDSGIYRLKRGSTDPRKEENHDFKRQLVWVTPKDEEPELWWCNDLGEWFLVSFERMIPVHIPE